MTTAPHHPALISKPVRMESGLKKTGERVFVSPRVVDEQAFNEFSMELRGLIDEVRAVQSELDSSRSAAAETAKELSGSQSKYRQHLELTTKLLKALTAKSAEVEQTLAKLEARSARVEQIEQRIAGSLDEKIAVFEASLDDRLKRAEESYGERLTALESRFEERRSGIEREMGEMEEQFRARIEEQRASLEAAVTEQIEQARVDLSERATETARATIDRLSEEREAATGTIAELETARRELAAATGASLEHTLDQIREACGIAAKLVGWDPADPESNPDQPTEGSLGELLRRSVKTKEDADWAVRRLGSLRDQAKAAAEELGESIEASITLLDQLHTQRRRVDGEVGEALQRTEAAGQAIQQRERQLTELVLPLNEAAERAEQVMRDLCGGMSGAAELLADCQTSRERLGELATVVRGLAELLEPWREVMLGDGAPDQLPTPLAAVVERFEEQFGEDLMRMAETIESLLSRAGAESRA